MFIKHSSPSPYKKSLFPARAARLRVFYHVNIFTSCACVEQKTLRTAAPQLQPDHMETMIVDLRGIYSKRPNLCSQITAYQRRLFGPDVVLSFCAAEREKTRAKQIGTILFFSLLLLLICNLACNAPHRHGVPLKCHYGLRSNLHHMGWEG